MTKRAPSGSAARYVPEPGERYDGWTVVRVVGRKPGKGTLMVEVRCECGTQGERAFSMIRRGQSTNCGCRRAQKHFYRGGVLHRHADGSGPIVKHNQEPTPGGTVLTPEVVEHMRRHGVTRIERSGEEP